MNNKRGSSVLGAAVVGAAMGAVAVALSHKPTRKKIKGALMNAIEAGDERLGDASRKVEDVKSVARKRAVKELKNIQEKLNKN